MKTYKAETPSGRAKEPFFFLTHGAGGDLDSAGLVSMSRLLAGMGHLCLRVNLPYRIAGRKSPPPAEKSIAGFVESFEQAAEEHGPAARWVVGGRSYGGRVASMAVADGLEAAGLILFPYPLHRPGDPSVPRTEHWPGIRTPCLFIQGTKDPFCDMEVLKRELRKMETRTNLVTVEGGDHSLKVKSDNRSGSAAKSEAEVLAGLETDIRQWIERL